VTDSFHIGLHDGITKTAMSLKKALAGTAATGAVAYGIGRRHGAAKADKENKRISDWMDSNGKYVPLEVINGSSKTASEIPDRVIAAAITGAFLGSALADRPEDRKKYMVGGALVGGFLSHKRMQQELRRGLAQIV
jgi:hypothetical protein